MKKITIIITIFLTIYLLKIYLNQDKSWMMQLPHCPCVAPDINNTNDGWAVDIGNIVYFHTGANTCFRSYPAVQTPQGKSGQQCCYDENNQLIINTIAAGTPDKIGNCAGEKEDGTMIVDYVQTIGHFLKDVIPFFIFDIEKYHQNWKPNKGENCN
jgi:hypothetical protein